MTSFTSLLEIYFVLVFSLHFSLEWSSYLIDQDPFHWIPPHTTHNPIGFLFLLMQCPHSYCSSDCLFTSLAWRRGCEVPWLKWLQISRQMEKRVWRIKLCDVTSGTGRLWIRLSEEHFTQGSELNAGLSPPQAKHRIPTTSFLYCFDLDKLQLLFEKHTYAVLTSIAACV